MKIKRYNIRAAEILLFLLVLGAVCGCTACNAVIRKQERAKMTADESSIDGVAADESVFDGAAVGEPAFDGAEVGESAFDGAEVGELAIDEPSFDKGSSDARISVTTTLFPYYDFVRQIAGDRVKLRLIIPSGMDSHSFEPTPADIIAIQNSDLFLYNGGEMEQWADVVLASIGDSGLRAEAMMDYVETVEEELVEGMEDGHFPGEHEHGLEEDEHFPGEHEHGLEKDEYFPGEHEHGLGEDEHLPGELHAIEYDEHIWTSPVKAMEIVRVIGRLLEEEDPANCAFYQENTGKYLDELLALHQEFLEVMAERKQDRIIVGDKFPFRYFADTYHLSYRAAFSGCGGEAEPSARTIAYLIEQVRERGLTAVFYLELSSHRVAEIIGEETGAMPLLLHSCHNVTRREFDEGITYLQLMEQNVNNLRIGLEAGQ